MSRSNADDFDCNSISAISACTILLALATVILLSVGCHEIYPVCYVPVRQERTTGTVVGTETRSSTTQFCNRSGQRCYDSTIYYTVTRFEYTKDNTVHSCNVVIYDDNAYNIVPTVGTSMYIYINSVTNQCKVLKDHNEKNAVYAGFACLGAFIISSIILVLYIRGTRARH
jgi:hypothetical protein